MLRLMEAERVRELALKALRGVVDAGFGISQC